MRWPAYPAYKASGVEWLRDVPEHWALPALARRYSIDLGKMLHENRIVGEWLLPYLRNIDVQWDQINFDDLPQIDVAPVERGRYTVRSGDLLVCEGGEVGRSAIVPSIDRDYAYQKALHRMRPTSAQDVPRFMFYMLQAAAAVGVFIAEGNPNTIPHLTGQKLRRYRFPAPSQSEQRTIAGFLDARLAKLDALVAKKRALVEKLKEKRSALIARTVTRGLPPDEAQAAGFEPHPTLRPSGVEWLGEVPEHWQAGNLRRFAKMKTGHTPSRQHPEYWEDCTIPWFTLADVWQIRDERRVHLGETKEMISALGVANSAAELLPAGTVVLSRTASVGYSGIMPTPMATSQDFWNWVCGPKLLPDYLLLVLRAMKHELARSTMGSTHKTIYQSDAAALCIPLPPLSEQDAIAKYIGRETGRIDSLITKVETAIDRLQEYRTALITAAVTGRIDVRGFAA